MKRVSDLEGVYMNLSEYNSFDIRKTYFKEKSELIAWDKYNSLYKTLRFANEVGGPDIEFCRFSVDVFKEYAFYSDWDVIKRKKDSYVLGKSNDFNITADIMNGWWYPFKKFIRYKKGTKKAIIRDLTEQFKYIKANELVEFLHKKYNRDKKTCEALIDFLDNVYTIGNITPAGWNPGTGGYDLWDGKLKLLKEKWFDNLTDKENVFKMAKDNPKNRSTILKWAPFLWKYFTEHNQNNAELDWKNFICKNYYQDYVEVEEKYKIRPLLEFIPTTGDEELCEKLKVITGQIKGRSGRIIKSTVINYCTKNQSM